METQSIIVAARFLAWTSMLAQAGIMAHIILRFDMRQTIVQQMPYFHLYRKHVLIGLFLGALGWFAHQLFFWLLQVASNNKALAFRLSLIDDLAWLTIPTYVCIAVGTSLVMTPYTASRFGALWWVASAFAGITLFLIGYANA